MLKNRKLLLFIILLFICTFSSAKAQTIECEYGNSGLVVKFDESGTSEINQDFYPNSDTPWWVNWFINNSSGNIEATQNLAVQPYELIGSCPEKIYTCKYEEWSVNAGIKNLFNGETGRFLHLKKVYLFYSEGEMNDNSELAAVENTGEWDATSEYITSLIEGYEACSDYDAWWLDEITGGLCASVSFVWTAGVKSLWAAEEFAVKRKECFTAEYSGDLPTYNLACPNLNVYLGRFNLALNEYTSCPDSDAVCKSKAITNVNEKETLIKDYCKSIMQEQDYDGGTEQDCIDACLNIAVQTTKAKKAVGLLSEAGGDCSVSGRMLVWVSNIMRWIKYILPVIVIVMGILDFIKAIGADKEDEMKKAQSKFIKRLIAAALVFLVPLIIEFALDKMGFGYNDCGIL